MLVLLLNGWDCLIVCYLTQFAVMSSLCPVMCIAEQNEEMIDIVQVLTQQQHV